MIVAVAAAIAAAVAVGAVGAVGAVVVGAVGALGVVGAVDAVGSVGADGLPLLLLHLLLLLLLLLVFCWCCCCSCCCCCCAKVWPRSCCVAGVAVAVVQKGHRGCRLPTEDSCKVGQGEKPAATATAIEPATAPPPSTTAVPAAPRLASEEKTNWPCTTSTAGQVRHTRRSSHCKLPVRESSRHCGSVVVAVMMADEVVGSLDKTTNIKNIHPK